MMLFFSILKYIWKDQDSVTGNYDALQITWCTGSVIVKHTSVYSEVMPDFHPLQYGGLISQHLTRIESALKPVLIDSKAHCMQYTP